MNSKLLFNYKNIDNMIKNRLVNVKFITKRFRAKLLLIEKKFCFLILIKDNIFFIIRSTLQILIT